MTYNKAQHATPYSAVATHATSSVATKTGVAGSAHYVTDVSGSSDKAQSTITVKSASTVIWQDQIMQTAAGNSSYHHTFETPIGGVLGETITVTVDSTAVGYANVAGFTL